MRAILNSAALWLIKESGIAWGHVSRFFVNLIHGDSQAILFSLMAITLAVFAGTLLVRRHW